MKKRITIITMYGHSATYDEKDWEINRKDKYRDWYGMGFTRLKHPEDSDIKHEYVFYPDHAVAMVEIKEYKKQEADVVS